jgi:hypothetical protein
MPAVLDGPDAEAAWLDPSVDLDGALELVRSYTHPLEIAPAAPPVRDEHAQVALF